MFTLKFKLNETYSLNLIVELMALSRNLQFSKFRKHSSFIFDSLVIQNSNAIYLKLSKSFRIEFTNNIYYLHIIFVESEYDANVFTEYIHYFENVLYYDNCKISIYTEDLLREIKFESADI